MKKLQKCNEKGSIVHFWQLSRICLIEVSGDLASASCVQSIATCCFSHNILRKSGLTHFMIGTGRHMLDNHGHSLLLHQNSTSGIFSKAGCDVESEATSALLSPHLLVLELQMSEFVYHAWVTGRITLHVLTHLFIDFQKLTCVDVTAQLIRKILVLGEPIRWHMAVVQGSEWC